MSSMLSGAFRRSLPRCSRIMTLPQLSPTHSMGKIIAFSVEEGTSVASYDVVLKIECSPDLMTEAYRSRDKEIMLIETHDPGRIKNLKTFYLNQWLPVNTELGIVDDGDPVDGEWAWQAYTTSDEKEEEEEEENVPEKAM